MAFNFSTLFINIVVSFSLGYVLTGHIQVGTLAALIVGVAGWKWIRVKKKETIEEFEYDERVNKNIQNYSFQTFSIANLLLLVYLLVSNLILKVQLFNLNYLIIYLSMTFYFAFYIIPVIAKRR